MKTTLVFIITKFFDEEANRLFQLFSLGQLGNFLVLFKGFQANFSVFSHPGIGMGLGDKIERRYGNGLLLFDQLVDGRSCRFVIFALKAGYERFKKHLVDGVQYALGGTGHTLHHTGKLLFKIAQFDLCFFLYYAIGDYD